MQWQCKENSFINPSGYRQIFKESELIMLFTIYFQLISDGYVEIDAANQDEAIEKVEDMSDKELFDIANSPELVITDKDGFAL